MSIQTITNRLQLVECAVAAGIKIPADLSVEDWDANAHFELLCATMMNKNLQHPRAHYDNAVIIASLSEEQSSEISDKTLKSMGFLFGDEK